MLRRKRSRSPARSPRPQPSTVVDEDLHMPLSDGGVAGDKIMLCSNIESNNNIDDDVETVNDMSDKFKKVRIKMTPGEIRC